MPLNITVPARLRTAWVGRQTGQTDAQAAAAGATTIRAADMEALDASRVAHAAALLELEATIKAQVFVEVSQSAYDAMTATQKAASYYTIVPDNNLAADTQSLLNAGNLDRFALRGTGGVLSATTVSGVGAVMVTSTSSSASRDLGVGSTVAVTPGRSYRVAATMRHHVKWDASMRVDVIWRTSADATISTVTGVETTVPAVGADIVLTQTSVGPAPSNAASMEVRVRGASNTIAPSLNGAISVRNVTVNAL